MMYAGMLVSYGALLLLRLLFFSSRRGALLHNRWLLWFNRHLALNPESGKSRYFAIVKQGLEWSPNVILWERKMYDLSPPVRRRMMQNVFYWKGLVGNRRLERWRKKGIHVPLHIFVSPTYRCNLHCVSCYARSPRPGDLPFDVLERLVREQEELGVFHVTLLGGEPFVRKDLWELFRKYPKTLFTVFTNGYFLGATEIERIRRLGNVRLVLSVEGFQQRTDERRGQGAFAQVERVLLLCKQANICYGISVTATAQNFHEVTSKEFLEWAVAAGCFYINYSSFVPMSASDAGFRLSSEQMKELLALGESMMTSYPLLIAIGQNGSDFVTACDAGGRMVHIDAFGNITPCMFVPWAVDNIKEKGLIAAMQSPFFQVLRGLSATGEPSVNPCKAYRSPLVQGILQGHARPTNSMEVNRARVRGNLEGPTERKGQAGGRTRASRSAARGDENPNRGIRSAAGGVSEIVEPEERSRG